ncbi:MAG: hypothetical protein NT096_12510, partial [Proteobacteria bacterium]|nr:hypothetical protein [Pseudomonadota bacterium]
IRINLVDDYPLEGIRWGRQEVGTLLKDVLGISSISFPKDKGVKRDLLVGQFKVLPSGLKPIKFKYKSIH